VRRSRQLSAESIAADLQTLCGLQISSRTVRRELHGMGLHGELLHPSLTSPNILQSVRCSGVNKAHRHWTGQWTHVLWNDQSHFSVWQSDGWGLGLVVSRRTVLAWMHCGRCKVWWRRNYGWLFFRGWAWLLTSSEKIICFSTKTFWTIPSSQLCGNSLGKAPSCSNMTAHQCTKQGP